jgi:hypothetical protein
VGLRFYILPCSFFLFSLNAAYLSFMPVVSYISFSSNIILERLFNRSSFAVVMLVNKLIETNHITLTYIL